MTESETIGQNDNNEDTATSLHVHRSTGASG